MKKALVTGGAGFLGSQVVRQLVGRGVSVRVLALPTEPMDNLDGLDVEVMRGNVLGLDDVQAAVRGMDTVFHCAAIYKDYMANPAPMYQVNLRGTFNVLEASRRADIERVVYTASVAALGRPAPGELADENTEYEAWDLNFHYSRTKHLGMLTALDFANWGLDVRIVCPALVLGPGDIAPTPSGKLILNVLSGKAPAYTAGGFCYVDVRDAAAVHVLAADKGKAGQTYVASGHNLDHKGFLDAIARACHGPLPRPYKVPKAVALAVVRGLTLAKLAAGEQPDMTPEYFSYSLQPGFFSSAKACTELGATFRPIEETLRDSIEYFEERGFLERSAR